MIPDVLLIAALAWGAFAFGAVYPWAFWPLAAAASSVGIAGLAIGPRSHGSIRGLGLTALTIAFCAFLLAVILQLVPAPLPFLASVSPESARVIPQMDLAVAAGSVSRHAFSIAPARTQLAVVLFAANALLLLGCARLFSIRGARRVAVAITAIGVALALTGIIQKPLFAGKIYGFWTPQTDGNPFGPFVNKNHFAGWMVMALPLTIGMLYGDIARGMRHVKPTLRDRVLWLSSPEANRFVLLAAASAVMALAIVLTMSRSGMCAAMLALVLTSGVALRRLGTATRPTIVTAYLLCVVMLVGGWVGVDAIADRFGSADWSEFNGRRGPWADAAGIFWRFPLTGTGLNTYGVATLFYQQHDLKWHYAQAHNDYLQLAAEGGALLTIPALLCVALFATAVRKRFKEETGTSGYWVRVGAVTGLAAIALQETVEFSLQMPGNAVLFAVLCGIALHRSPERSSR
jgi:O-antigen ligase